MSVGLDGMKGHIVAVEANVRADTEQCVIVGLPDTSMKESKERILSCLHALDLDTSMKKITVHLSPSDKRKIGTGYDAAMLLAVLRQMIEEPIPIDRTTCILASLSLDGRLVPFYGLVPAIQQAVLLGFKRILLPPVDVRLLEGSLTAELVPLSDVLQLIGYLRGQLSLEMDLPQQLIDDEEETELLEALDFSAVRGHADVKRVLEIAAAGGHHVLMSGPSGCGKSMLADAFHTILPDLPHKETLEVYSIYHLAKENRGFSVRPPYRPPHHCRFWDFAYRRGDISEAGRDFTCTSRGVVFRRAGRVFSKDTGHAGSTDGKR